MAAALFAAPERIAAQDVTDSAAYLALIHTPLAALAPAPDLAMTPLRRGIGIDFRYGLQTYTGDAHIQNVAVGLDVPVGPGRLGVAVGRWAAACSTSCPGHFMAGITYRDNLVTAALGRPDSRGSISVGLELGAGYARPTAGTLVSSSASVPIALVPGSGGVRLFPFITPGLGVGSAPEPEGREAGLLPTLAAGVGVLTADGRLGMNFGLHRAFLKGGNWLAGAGLRWTGGRRR
jgi:hypothetical protein